MPKCEKVADIVANELINPPLRVSSTSNERSCVAPALVFELEEYILAVGFLPIALTSLCCFTHFLLDF